MKRILFIDRDGTLIREPESLQVDTLEQLSFVPGVIRNLSFIRQHLDFLFVMVTNQDGLGTPAYPQEHFDAVQGKMLEILASEGIGFDAVHVDTTYAADQAPTRKPGTALLTRYMDGSYDLEHSYVIGDRLNDVKLAKNLGCKAILLNADEEIFDRREPAREETLTAADLGLTAADCFQTDSWDKAAEYLFAGERHARVHRVSKETDVLVDIDLDGHGSSHIDTGLKFFDHMLEQIGKHARIDLTVVTRGDLEVDEHHTIEDTAIALGEALLEALGSKRGIERYGYCLPMDDSLCTLALDFGGRPWLVWDVKLSRERVGDVPTEMFFHFFKSLSDAARMNLNIKVEGDNEHHKLESLFKAFALALRMAVRRDIFHYELPTTKGLL